MALKTNEVYWLKFPTNQLNLLEQRLKACLSKPDLTVSSGSGTTSYASYLSYKEASAALEIAYSVIAKNDVCGSWVFNAADWEALVTTLADHTKAKHEEKACQEQEKKRKETLTNDLAKVNDEAQKALQKLSGLYQQRDAFNREVKESSERAQGFSGEADKVYGALVDKVEPLARSIQDDIEMDQ